MRNFPGFKIPDPYRIENPHYVGLDRPVAIPWPDDARAYYERERYTLAFYDGANNLNQDVNGIWYQESLKDYNWTPAPPANKPGYTFAGWHTDALVQNESTLFDFENATMPVGGMILYAKWNAPTYQVSFDLAGGQGTNPVAQNIALGGYINPPTEPVREGYAFNGWKERNRTVAYNVATPVNRHLDLIASWIPQQSGAYTVHYLELGTGKVLHEAVTVDNLQVSSSHTVVAERIEGFLPDAPTKSRSVNVNAVYNAITFYYKPFTSVNFTVRYESTTGEALAESVIKSTTDTYTTENFKRVEGYYPNEEQITLPLSYNENLNQLVFTYLPSDGIRYQVLHYLQNLDGTSYTLAESELLSGQTNAIASGAPRSYTGFYHNSSKGKINGVISANGTLILELYYDRQALAVTFAASTGGSLHGTSSYSGILWGTPFADATSIPTPVAQSGYTFVGWSPALPYLSAAVTQDATYWAVFEPVATPPVAQVRVTAPWGLKKVS